MTTTYSKVKSIADDLGLSESKVTMVLYDYLTYCMQEALLDGESHTIFGKLTLNDNDRFVLENDKFGLIGLLGKKDLKLLRKIAEDGPDSSVFQI
jgi:hypothetical protein